MQVFFLPRLSCDLSACFIWQLLSVGRQWGGYVSAYESSALHKLIYLLLSDECAQCVFLNVSNHFWLTEYYLVL